ncbi:16S rRNA (cytosine(1402)-N(4))-methyltransferase RsmH [Spiroplasma diminutum]|uniref:Ribosomal RNA small subunit methyltransferase H n=1 Tax=Spiroplasma diminutum CUAS-1 TaxID=1276221 RepID=S5MEY4_9MOLU|nr:16S rRNA (cytosine(1402)-N(4))-methyltransferase RsmH [Spiroplasma diminutum]AGR42338.1 S-adenosyl-methyltransferase MraW [Spiroplasma diminutum CUAS-1]
MAQEHTSVLLNESIDLLNIKSNGIYVDCTLGRAGHSAEILKKIDQGHLYAIDQDQDAIAISRKKLECISSNFTILEGNFADIKVLLSLSGIKKVDGILYDLGVSSPQFDKADRGFSYRFNSDLDMRMDQKNTKITAKEVVNTFTDKQLADIFFQYGDEKFSWEIAKKIIIKRQEKEIKTTFELVDIIKECLPQKVLKQKKHPAKKVFQALRIYINDELEVLKRSLNNSLELLNPGGVICVITFHSLEEKIIKDIFKTKTTSKEDKFLRKLPIAMEIKKDYELVIKKPVLPGEQELLDNRRAHSAKLWAIRKVGE